MAPKSQRSRACPQCRERRVKCDETPDFCNQCRRLGLACSGPTVGSIVIDMTERVAKPRGRKKKESSRIDVAIREKTDQDANAPQKVRLPRMQLERKSSVLDMPIPNPLFPTERRYTADVERAVTAIRYQYRPPILYQPTKVNPMALDSAFLSHYVKFNSGSRTYSPEIQWLNHLPRIHAESTKPAVNLSLRALSMVFYAKTHHDQGILVDSWRWYSVSLSAQRTSLSNLKENEIPEEGEVLVPLILSLYELYCGQTASGSMIHLSAAARILNLRGPSNCKTGAIWPLFKGIRNAEAHKSIVFGKSSVYATPEWMTVPFIDMPRDAHQRLADIELMIPVCMEKLHTGISLRSFFATPIPPHVDVKPCRELTSQLMADLNQWAAWYPNLTLVSKVPEDVTRFTNRSGKGLDLANEDPKNLPMADTFIALIASNYVSTKLILNMLMYKMDTQEIGAPPDPSPATIAYFTEASRCARAILRAAANIEKMQTPGFDLLRSITPLVTVVCVGPGEEHFKEAGAMLYRWGSKIGGLSSILEKHILA